MTTRRDFMKGATALGGLPLLSMLGLVDVTLAETDEQSLEEIKQPPLPYLPEVLEPHLDGRTMRIHYHKHHAAHVIALNRALRALREAREKNDFSRINSLSSDLTVHAAGHLNHVIYFSGMAPIRNGGGQEPVGGLADRIKKEFGSYQKFKAHFTAAALGLAGNGWAVLGYHPMLDRLLITQVSQEQNTCVLGLVPLMMIDMWEHAYYLQFQTKREDYIKAWWQGAHWTQALRRFAIIAP